MYLRLSVCVIVHVCICVMCALFFCVLVFVRACGVTPVGLAQSLLLRVSMDKAGFVVSHGRQAAGGGEVDFDGDVVMMSIGPVIPEAVIFMGSPHAPS